MDMGKMDDRLKSLHNGGRLKRIKKELLGIVASSRLRLNAAQSNLILLRRKLTQDRYQDHIQLLLIAIREVERYIIKHLRDRNEEEQQRAQQRAQQQLAQQQLAQQQRAQNDNQTTESEEIHDEDSPPPPISTRRTGATPPKIDDNSNKAENEKKDEGSDLDDDGDSDDAETPTASSL